MTSQHPMVQMAPSKWAKLSDGRRKFENAIAAKRLRESLVTFAGQGSACKCGAPVCATHPVCEECKAQ